MAEIKCVVGYKGKSYQKSFENQFNGMKIGDRINGSLLGLKDYELEITGGSDNCGFPMRKGIATHIRKKGLFGKGVGVRKRIDRKGKKIRKSVVGSQVSDSISQLNLKVLKAGSEDLEKYFEKTEKDKTIK